MASECTVCLVVLEGNIQDIALKLKEYDWDKLGSLGISEEIGWAFPHCVYNDIEINNDTIWFKTKRHCSDTFIQWLAKESKAKIINAVWNDCDNDEYRVNVTDTSGKQQFIGAVDICDFCFPNKLSKDERSQYFKDMLLKVENKSC